MENKNDKPKTSNAYDDNNIPKVDLPQGNNSEKLNKAVEPWPEDRPRKDGPGGN